MLKRLAMVMAISTTVTGAMSCIYAKENQESIIDQKAITFTSDFYTTAPTYQYRPTFSDFRSVTINSKLCVQFHVEANSTIIDVQIDGKSATKRDYGTSSAGDYYIEASGSKTYSFYARDYNGETWENQYVNVADNVKPTVTLSKNYKSGYCYLTIKAEDNSSISTVKVNGTSISFPSNGGTQDYRVTDSKTYTVEVTDASGNTTTEKIDININDDKPSLTLDKVLKDGKWYLTIKAYPGSGARISKVTVNNTSISFSSSGEIKEYQVPSTGDYNVVVTDNYNQQISQKLYIDCAINSESTKPALTAVAKDMGGVMGIGISVYPSNQLANNGIQQLTVNGVAVPIANAGGKVDYDVRVSGTYTVVATDAYGNSSTQTVAVVVPTAQSSAVTGQGTETSGGSSKAVFKINQKSYNLNGTTEKMEGAPVLRSGRTMLPTRYVAYAVNISPSQIKWDKTTKEVTINDGNNVIKLKLNSKIMTVNGVEQTMEVPATMINNLVYIPISQIKKAFQGVSVNWNKNTKEVTVTRN